MVGFIALGLWQIERRAWKLDLIAQVDARVRATPAPLPARSAWPRINDRDDAYRRVRATGYYDYAAETMVKAVTERGSGFWALTPLHTDRETVLVNRGFVPDTLPAAARRGAGRRAGLVTVTGLLRLSEPGGGFLRSNDSFAGRWYSRDVAAIASARRLEHVAPFFIDADATPNPAGYPVGGLTVIRFRNSHLEYALTWFGLAGLCGWAAMVLLSRQGAA